MKNPTSDAWPVGTAPSADFCGEDARLGVLESFQVEELKDDPELQALVNFAAELAEVPTALVSLVEQDRQRFLARFGLSQTETPRKVSFCAHAMLVGSGLTVEDAREDERFADNPLVTGEPHIRFYHGQPLVSDEGAPLGALCLISNEPRPGGLTATQKRGIEVLAQAVMRRLSARRMKIAGERELAESDARFRLMSDHIPDIAWTCDDELQFDYYNAKWLETTGRPGPLELADWEPFVHPDDWQRVQDQWSRTTSAHDVFQCEYRLLQADGNHRWALARAVPIEDGEGRVYRWFGTLTDIDDGYRLSESRDLLAKELSHRIKNIFAVITGLISLNVRQAPEHKPFADGLIATLRALGRAHEYVRPVDETGTSRDTLQGLFADLFAPYGGGEHSRVKVSGDDLPVAPRAATPMALIFHELATNSAKYGALATDDGHVDLTVEDKGTHVLVCWSEHGMLRKPDLTHEGFGSRLVDMSVRGSLEGDWERRFGDDGLVVELTLSKAALSG